MNVSIFKEVNEVVNEVVTDLIKIVEEEIMIKEINNKLNRMKKEEDGFNNYFEYCLNNIRYDFIGLPDYEIDRIIIDEWESFYLEDKYEWLEKENNLIEED